jgi:hypothetical protein
MSNSSRYDVMIARSYTDSQGATKTAWTKIGIAFPMKDREGFDVSLEALPLPTLYNGKLECKLKLFPPKEREEQPRGRQPADLGDESIPF